MTLEASQLTSGLKSRLSSSLPLESKCTLAVNTFTSRVLIPGKHEVILDWILSSLEIKYQQRQETVDCHKETELWSLLHTCLKHLNEYSDVQYNFSRVPDFLLNILPNVDISQCSVLCSIELLLVLGSRCVTDAYVWSNTLTVIIQNMNKSTEVFSKLITPVIDILSNITLLPGPLVSPLLTQLTLIWPNCRTDHQLILTKVTTRLLFSDTGDYMPLFNHLTGEQEIKYHSGPHVSTLLSCLQEGGDPCLLLAACPPNPGWLRPRLWSMLMYLSGYPSLVNINTVIGGQLGQIRKKVTTDRVSDLLGIVLPIEDLNMEIKSGWSVSKCLNDVIRQCLKLHDDIVTKIISKVHQHHPQLLEPLAPNLMIKHLQIGCPDIFRCVLDVSLKLRQFPKLISKLFLHLRSLESSTNSDLHWKKNDMDIIGKTITTLPRVQSLEMWKTLNYHFAEDCISSSPHSDTAAGLLGPLLATLLTNSLVADHNLPSSLLPRILDLAENTVKSLDIVFNMENISCNFKELLIQVTTAIVELSNLFVKYRNIDKFDYINSLVKKVSARIFEQKDLLNILASRKLIDIQAEHFDECWELLIDSPELLMDKLDKIPDIPMLKMIKLQPNFNLVAIHENKRFCATAIFASLENLNLNYSIGNLDIWTNPKNWTDMTSELAKIVVDGLKSLMTSDRTSSDLSTYYLNLLSALPLENLPTVLRLGATFVFLSQVFGGSQLENVSMLSARCLENTEIFRYINVGKFIISVLSTKGPRTELVHVVSSGVGKFTKTIQDINENFKEFEDYSAGEQNEHLQVAINMFQSLSPVFSGDFEGTEKRISGQELADKLVKFFSRVFKKKDLENVRQMDLLCQASAQVVSIYAKSGLGKSSKLVFKMIDLTFSEIYSSWKQLLKSICMNLEFLDNEMLPDDWKNKAWATLVNHFDESCFELLEAMMKTAELEEFDQMIFFIVQQKIFNLCLWKSIINCVVSDEKVAIKKKHVEAAVGVIVQKIGQEGYAEYSQVTPFLASVFTSSPPCISMGLEMLCLATQSFLPPEMAPSCLQTTATFISRRSTLSTRCIPVITSLVRHFISVRPITLPTIHSLQSLLGLFSRQKTDWSSVIHYLLADLLHCLPSLSPDLKHNFTIAVLPLVDSLDKHNREYLSTNLPPATNEVFKHVLATHTSSHKFKGKV